MRLKTLCTVVAVGVVLVGTPVLSAPSEATPPSPQHHIDLDICCVTFGGLILWGFRW